MQDFRQQYIRHTYTCTFAVPMVVHNNIQRPTACKGSDLNIKKWFHSNGKCMSFQVVAFQVFIVSLKTTCEKARFLVSP